LACGILTGKYNNSPDFIEVEGRFKNLSDDAYVRERL
jgi:hypothetical protein